MPMSSKEFAKEIKKGLVAAEHALSEAQREVAENLVERTSIQEKLNDLFTELADRRIEQLQRLPKEVRQQLDYRLEEEKNWQKRVQQTQEQVDQLQKKQADLIDKESRLVSDIDQELQKNPEYRRLCALRQETAAEWESLRSTVEEIRSECQEKLPAFESDQLYSYLARKHFDTDQYRANFIVRSIDRYVARIIGYQTNRRNQKMLLAMLDEVDSKTKAVTTELDLLDQKLVTLRAPAESSEEIVLVRHEIAEHNHRIAAERNKLCELTEALEEHAQHRDYRYKEARRLMVLHLAALDNVELLKEAELGRVDQTRQHDFRRFKEQLEECEAKHKELMARKQCKDEENARAKVLERRLRTSDYAGAEYEYSHSLDVTGLFAAYLVGELTSVDVEREVKKHRSIVDKPSYSGSNWTSSSASNGPSLAASSLFGSSSSLTSNRRESSDDDNGYLWSSNSNSENSSESVSRTSSFTTSSDSSSSSYSSSDSSPFITSDSF